MTNHASKLLLTLTLSLACFNLYAEGKGMVSLNSQYSVAQTEQRLINILNKKGFTLFKQVNHTEGAKAVGIQMPETRVVIFGKPQIGSKLMQCSPSVAIDLPQKMLIWEEGGQVKLAYNSPRFLNKRHQMSACEDLLKKINNALNKISELAVGAK